MSASTTTQIFLFIVAFSYLSAFGSLYWQWSGLYGDDGVTPAAIFFEQRAARITTPNTLERLRKESMDLVIDDGDHRPIANAMTLVNFWHLVKPGGFYVVEDVTTGGNDNGHYMNPRRWPLQPPGYAWLAHNGTHWPRAVRDIYEQNDVFMADTLVGQREWEDYQERNEGAWLRDRVNHNSHLLVIRKRRHGPRLRPVRRAVRKISNATGRRGGRADAVL